MMGRTSMSDLRDFPPVEENVEAPPTLRQSFLDKLDRCPRSAYLYLKYDGGSTSHAMDRGTAFHEMAEQATKLMIENQENQMDPQQCRDLQEQIIRERPDLTIPIEEHEGLRQMAWNWGKATKINRANIVGVERTAALQVGDRILTGTIDLAYQAGSKGVVIDYKTSLHMPNQETFERQFQGQMYGLLLSEGHWITYDEDGEIVWGARCCEGPLKTVTVFQVFPRFYDEDTGRLLARTVEFDVADLVDFKVALVSLTEKFEHGLKTGEWPAVPGYHCGFCPKASECPIPEHYRDIKTIETDEEATALAQVWDRIVEQGKQARATLRAYAEATEKPIDIGPDAVLTFYPVKSEPIKDKEKLKDALAKNVGNPADFFSDRTTTRFDKRRKEGA
jgi:hypothetical protein